MSVAQPGSASERFARLSALPLREVGGLRPFTPQGFVGSIRDILAHREMLDLLVKRDLKSRYKDSALGFLWSLARPLVQLLIYFVVLGQFIGAARGIPDFAIFIFSGLTAMGLFTEIAVGGTGSILANAGLVKKVYVPRELFPLASTGSALFNFAVQLLVLLVATVVAGKPPIHPQVAYVIPSLALIVVYGLAFALLLGALNVYLRDVQYLVEVATMLLFWASPVVYAWSMVKGLIHHAWILDIYTNNPLTLAVIGFQKAFWVAGDALPQPDDLLVRQLVALVIGLILLVLSHRVFLRLQGNFAQEL
ncbi:ABC transporter permease [Microbacterium sp.]|uniref:ABC transporter permease n=1 Tax=Microbacterium sp. TaxID=51671 RepID=UPI001AC50BCE|nr:ABC transporter permease [Microbacterium sp.]MBN9156326.1 ABC transporter permease [Microbacterium sp.]MBS1899155.1 ABC transporter permease [Actinomycetota bacterium]